MVPIPIVPIVGIQPLEVSVFVIRTPQIRTVPSSGKSSHSTPHSLSDVSLPKSENTQHNSVQASTEVKKLPSFIPVGRNRMKKGPKKYYHLSNEKPGNPDEIDPVNLRDKVYQ